MLSKGQAYLGCVPRLGLTEPQIVTILFVDHRFNRHVEFNQAKEMMSQIVGQGKSVFGAAIVNARATQSSAPPVLEDEDSTEDVENITVKEEADNILQRMLG